MPTEAQLQANRANARKSCGPRTDEGKAKSRLNALKHGMRARTVGPVLPREDPAELQAKIREWLDDHRPTSVVERELVARAARLSWTLDRAERYETALLSKQVRKAMLRSKGRRIERVCELGRKLFYNTGKRLTPGDGPAWSDNPSAFVARLEEGPEGARWLLDRWVEIRCLLISRENWTFLDQFKFVRLLGKQPFAAIDDPELNEVFLAWETIEEKWGVRFWLQMQELTPSADPAFSSRRVWREIVPRPDSPEAAFAFLTGIAQREIDRLQDLIVDLEEIEGDDAVELAEQASFRASDAGERLRRFQTARTRELLRTIDLLTKLRAASIKATKEPNPPTAENPAPRPSSDRSDSIETQAADGERPSRAPADDSSDTGSARKLGEGRRTVVGPDGPARVRDAQASPHPSRADRAPIRVRNPEWKRANEANGLNSQAISQQQLEPPKPSLVERERTELRRL